MGHCIAGTWHLKSPDRLKKTFLPGCVNVSLFDDSKLKRAYDANHSLLILLTLTEHLLRKNALTVELHRDQGEV